MAHPNCIQFVAWVFVFYAALLCKGLLGHIFLQTPWIKRVILEVYKPEKYRPGEGCVTFRSQHFLRFPQGFHLSSFMASSSTPLLLRQSQSLFTPFPNPKLLWKVGALLSESSSQAWHASSLWPLWQAAVGIINGAFGAHGLKNKISDSKLQAWGTASHYAVIYIPRYVTLTEFILL